MLSETGFKLIEVRPLLFAVRPSQFMWQWPAAFGLSNSQRLADLTRVSQEWSDAVQGEIAGLSANPNSIMITPMVLEIIAEKVGSPPGTRSSPTVCQSLASDQLAESSAGASVGRK